MVDAGRCPPLLPPPSAAARLLVVARGAGALPLASGAPLEANLSSRTPLSCMELVS